ncbi:glycosyltransferase [Chloroflexota bacterium]
MRICVVTPNFARYKGDMAGSWIYDLIIAIAQHHEVHVIYPSHLEPTLDWDEPIYRHEIPYPFKTYPLAQVKGLDLVKVAPLLWNYSREIRLVKRQHDIDLIHAFWTIPTGFVSALSRGKTPLVTSLMGSDLNVFGRGLIAKPIIRYPLKKSTRLIAISNDLKLEAIELGANADKISVMSDGINLNTFHPMDKKALRQKLGLPDRLIVLFVGSLFRIKRVDRLIRVSANLSKEFDFRILLIGDGPERPGLEELVEQLGLKERVTFMGFISHHDVPEYTAAADVFVLPSETEGLPKCVREAMACGIPIVASNVGGLPELITNGETGFLANDETEMENGLRQVMSSNEFREKMSTNALEFARQNFSLETAVQQHLDLYATMQSGSKDK